MSVDWDRFKVYLDTQFGPDLRGSYMSEPEAKKCVQRLRRQGWGADHIRIVDSAVGASTGMEKQP